MTVVDYAAINPELNPNDNLQEMLARDVYASGRQISTTQKIK